MIPFILSLFSPPLATALERARQAEAEAHELAGRVRSLTTLCELEEDRADAAEEELAQARERIAELERSIEDWREPSGERAAVSGEEAAE